MTEESENSGMYDFNLIDVDFTRIECMDKVVDENSHIMRPEDFEPEKEIRAKEVVECERKEKERPSATF